MAAGKTGKLIVGLIGQVCAGKSTVAAAFRSRGAQIYDADKAVHELYTRPEVIAEVRGLLGDEMLDGQGGIDRKALGRIVFSDPEKLKALTAQVVFPRAREVSQKAIEQFRTSAALVMVLDAPTLVEAGMLGLCDKVVFVSARSSRRLKWASARGWDSGELERRESCLLNEDERRGAATVVIHNEGTPDEVQDDVDQLLAEWL
jgi:dephospho-CoA kinase